MAVVKEEWVGVEGGGGGGPVKQPASRGPRSSLSDILCLLRIARKPLMFQVSTRSNLPWSRLRADIVRPLLLSHAHNLQQILRPTMLCCAGCSGYWNPHAQGIAVTTGIDTQHSFLINHVKPKSLATIRSLEAESVHTRKQRVKCRQSTYMGKIRLGS